MANIWRHPESVSWSMSGRLAGFGCRGGSVPVHLTTDLIRSYRRKNNSSVVKSRRLSDLAIITKRYKSNNYRLIADVNSIRVVNIANPRELFLSRVIYPIDQILMGQ